MRPTQALDKIVIRFITGIWCAMPGCWWYKRTFYSKHCKTYIPLFHRRIMMCTLNDIDYKCFSIMDY
jgi:hypothetical protein